MRIVALVVSFLLVSCASIEPQEFRGPSGKAAYSMRCSGFGRTLDACDKKARELCPSGYTIIAVVAVPPPISGGIMVAPQSDLGLAIECK